MGAGSRRRSKRPDVPLQGIRVTCNICCQHGDADALTTNAAIGGLQMEREQYQQIAIGVGLLAVVASIATGRLPRSLRATPVVALVALAGGAGLFAYRYVKTPTTLTVVAGSLDADMPRFMAGLASHMASNDSGIRLKVVDKGTAWETAKAFSAGEADLAIVRADANDLSAAQSVVVFARAVVLIVVLPVSAISDMDELKGKTIGLVGGPVN